MIIQCNERVKLPLSVCFAVLSLGSFGAYAADSTLDRVTYTRDVAPILNANCVECHRPGEVAPMSLQRYKELRPWAKDLVLVQGLSYGQAATIMTLPKSTVWDLVNDK